MKKFLEYIKENNSVFVDTGPYSRSHNKIPTGVGSWVFSSKKSGNIDFKDEKNVFMSNNKMFSVAKKDAKAWALANKHKTIYLLS